MDRVLMLLRSVLGRSARVCVIVCVGIDMVVSVTMFMRMTVFVQTAMALLAGLVMRFRFCVLLAAATRAMDAVVVKQPHGQAGDGIDRQHRKSQQKSRELFHEHCTLLQLNCDKNTEARIAMQPGNCTHPPNQALARFTGCGEIG